MYNFPLVTIITPTYKGSETLFGAISSILIQTYTSIEYILIDDGTKGFNKELVENFIEKNKRDNLVKYCVLVNKRNIGTVKTFNNALKISSGEYVFNLADDDEFYDENVLFDWVNEFIKTGESIITGNRIVYDNSLLNVITKEPNDLDKEFIKNSSPEDLFEKMAGYNMVFGCSTARKKSLLDSVDGFDERYRIIEDYPSNLRFLRMGIRIHYFDRDVVKYRLGGISFSERVDNRYFRESDKIFKNEIAPYVKDKASAKEKYKDWSNKIRYLNRKKELETLFSKYPNNKMARFFIYLGYSFRHPLHVLKKYIDDPVIIFKKLR